MSRSYKEKRGLLTGIQITAGESEFSLDDVAAAATRFHDSQEVFNLLIFFPAKQGAPG